MKACYTNVNVSRHISHDEIVFFGVPAIIVPVAGMAVNPWTFCHVDHCP